MILVEDANKSGKANPTDNQKTLKEMIRDLLLSNLSN